MKLSSLWPHTSRKSQTRDVEYLREYATSLYSVPPKDEVLHSILYSCEWNLSKAKLELQEYNDAQDKILASVPTHPDRLLGCEHHGGTSCYIDSLLVAMYLSMNAFDPLLTVDVNASNSNELQAALRLLVNKLRKGKLVNAHTMEILRSRLQDAGWNGRDGAGIFCQEDVTELFLFLTETFGQPFLPFQRRLFHGGHQDNDDDRVSTERLLTLPIPPATPNKVTCLEDILYDYFYSSVVPNIRRWVDLPVSHHKTSSDKSKIIEKEMPVAAWQVLELLPFYSSTNEVGDMSAAHYMQVIPESCVIVPIVLKRYGEGNLKNNRRVIIPVDIAVRQSVNQNAQGHHCTICEREREYVMTLKSAVCHIGNSLSSGHYIAYCHINNSWIKMDDRQIIGDRASRVSTYLEEAAVLHDISINGYMMFYELHDRCSHDHEDIPPYSSPIEARKIPPPFESASVSSRSTPPVDTPQSGRLYPTSTTSHHSVQRRHKVLSLCRTM